MSASSRELFHKLLWGVGSFILFLILVYWFLSGDLLRNLASLHFLTLIFSLLALLISVSFAFEVIVDLKKSLEEESPWTAETDLLFLMVFLALIVVSLVLIVVSLGFLFHSFARLALPTFTNGGMTLEVAYVLSFKGLAF